MRRLACLLLLAVCACSAGAIGAETLDGEPLAPVDAASDALVLDAAASADASAKDAAKDGPGAEAASDTASGAGDASAETPATGCGEFTAAADFVCAKDGRSRGRCAAGVAEVEACALGCLRVAGGPDQCMAAGWTWSCPGSYGKTKAADGDYYLTSFGCWTDASGVVHTDPGDNCIPGCLSKARSAGICSPSDDGPTCEEHVNWYVADSGRFGCLARVRVTNPASGKSVIALVLDAGPACWVEAKVSHAALDASPPVNKYLFGGDRGITDKALVHVVEVDPATSLGPE